MRTWIATTLSAVAAVAVTATPDTGYAAEEPVTRIEERAERVNSINGNPWGFLFGAYTLNYERLLGGRHGILVEAGFTHHGNDATSTTSFGGAVGYRLHLSPRQDSWFLGANVGFYTGTAESKIDGATYDLDVTSTYIVMNIGRRWMWDNGINITLRIGGGRGFYDVSTDSDDPAAVDAAAAVQDLLEFLPIALDSELSVGYAF